MTPEEEIERAINVLWRAVIVVSLIAAAAAIAGIYATIKVGQSQTETLRNRTLSYEKAAVECLVELIEIEREEMGLPLQPYCLQYEVARHYPVQVCGFVDVKGCGEAALAGE